MLERSYPVRLFAPLSRSPQKLGDILLTTGQLDRGILRAALARKHDCGAPLGTVLKSSGLVTPTALAEALAIQWGIGRIDLDRDAPDPDLLINLDLAACLRCNCLPWRKLDGTTIIALSDPYLAEDARRACGLQDKTVAVAIAPADQLRTVLEQTFYAELEQASRTACPEHLSCRSFTASGLRARTALALSALATLAVVAPVALFWLAFSWIIFANLVTSAMRLGALVANRLPAPPSTVPLRGIDRLSAHRKRPVISLLVPLHKEDLVLPALMRHLDGLDYPRELLDIKLLVEAGDTITAAAVDRLDFTQTADVITVPPHTLKTKPRALNYGLNFCRGEIIGILDAEDRPDADQLSHVIEHLHYAPGHVACVQGALDFYNPRRNWLARCFTIEYAIWFRVLLSGMRRMGLPVPLGGTTVYFRREHLEDLGGWDAHNVTEDADLGMRLARRGLTCEILPSTTWEEANCHALPWIRQRSRWLKGFMMTWLAHMRRPRALLRDLGLPGFLAFQTIFLGGVTAYLSIPVLWSLWITFAVVPPESLFGGPPLLWKTAFWSMILGQVVMLSVSLTATLARDKRHLIPWLLTLPLYWPLGALATLKALVEMLVIPFYWDKTRHGTYS